MFICILLVYDLMLAYIVMTCMPKLDWIVARILDDW